MHTIKTTLQQATHINDRIRETMITEGIEPGNNIIISGWQAAGPNGDALIKQLALTDAEWVHVQGVGDARCIDMIGWYAVELRPTDINRIIMGTLADGWLITRPPMADGRIINHVTDANLMAASLYTISEE